MGRHVARRAGRIPVYWWVVAVVLVLAGVAFGLAATSQSDHPARIVVWNRVVQRRIGARVLGSCGS